MGTWFDAERKGKCSNCRKAVAVGDEMYAKSKGVYLCSDCGTLAEATAPETGAQEKSCLYFLEKLPEEAVNGPLAQGMLYLARQLDQNDVSPREVTNYTKEIRLNMMQLRDLFPPDEGDDDTDIVRQRRERRMREMGGM